jgi:MFS family permease
MMPLWLFTRPIIGLSVLTTFMVGGVMYGTSVYLPIWAQGVQGFSATKSGMSLLWLSVGWPIASIIGGRFLMKMGSRPAILLGLGLNLAASAGLMILGRTYHDIPAFMFAVVTFVIGSGMGFSQLASVLAVQNSVEWAQRGVATALLTFQRTLGGLVWVSIMGSTMNVTLLRRMQNIPGVGAGSAKEAGDIANKLLDPQTWDLLPAGQLGALREALAAALRNVHILMVVAAALSLFVAFMLPNMHFGGAAADKKTNAK